MALSKEDLQKVSNAVNNFWKFYGFEKWKNETHFLMSNVRRDEELSKNAKKAA
jgi:hypothetical protein